jgi:hypothetical protein
VIEATRAGRRETEEARSYSWIEDHLARLDGKEARAEYYAWSTSGGDGTGIRTKGNGP